MGSRWVVVDDTDSRIQYTGDSWFLDKGSRDNIGNFGPSYESTLHGTQSNASLSFSFSGTSLTVLGSNNPNNDSGVIDPTWNCFVDNISIGPTAPFPFAENNWAFCEIYNLVDGPHVVTVNATVMRQQTFWFDQLKYIPSANVPLHNEAILVNNLDPSLQFGQGWSALGDTANLTTTTNSNLTFSFVGESLSWYAFIPAEYPHGPAAGLYSVDGATPVDFVLNGLPPEATIYNQKIFETSSYPAGPHKIVVTFLGNSSTTPLSLNYLIIQNGTISFTTSTSAPSSTGGTTGSPNTSGSSHSSNVGPIIGGVVGGLVLLAVAIVAFVYLRRWEKKQKDTLRSEDRGPDSMTVQPFFGATTLPPNGTGSGRTLQHPSQISRRGKPTEQSPQPAPTTTELNPILLPGSSPRRKRRLEAEVAATTASGSQRTPLTPPQSTTLATGTSHAIHHEDSGVRLPTGVPEDEMVELPPMYTLA